MNNETRVSVCGWVGRGPEKQSSGSGEWTRFRLGTTPWWKDANGQAISSRTEWFDVRVNHPALAANVLLSIRKGDPVIVHGRLRSASWEGQDGKPHWEMQIVAETVGPDLRWGHSTFTRFRLPGAEAPATPAEGEARLGQPVPESQLVEAGGGALGALSRAVEAAPPLVDTAIFE
ncbi:MAG: single-stranded DNA-binding protein, partial [Bifidobacteriaceae bacterium]|nr:single-stranded DNA-binding protein [Bifidobacteriaceae bacterium]